MADHPLCIEHCGFPMERSKEYFAGWRRAIRDLAKSQNARAKVSGLGMFDRNWTVDSFRPWVLECIEAFSPAASDVRDELALGSPREFLSRSHQCLRRPDCRVRPAGQTGDVRRQRGTSVSTLLPASALLPPKCLFGFICKRTITSLGDRMSRKSEEAYQAPALAKGLDVLEFLSGQTDLMRSRSSHGPWADREMKSTAW